MFWDWYEGFNFFLAAVAIDFVETSYTASEGDAPLEVCAMIVSLMGNLDCDLVVTFSELPGTAGMTIIFCYYMMVQNELKCKNHHLHKERPRAEHLTSLPKRKVGTLLSPSTFNHNLVIFLAILCP